MTQESCLAAWNTHLRSNPFYQYEAATLRSYNTSAKIVLRNMLEIEREPLPYRWTLDDLEAILDFWEEKDLRVSTRIGYHNALTSMASALGNPVPGSVRIKWPDEVIQIKWLTLPQIKTVFATPMSPMQAMGIELMARMGRRRIECMRAKVSDMVIDGPEDPYMIVDGKGRKKHKMPFAPTSMKILNTWLDDRQRIIEEQYDRKKLVEKVDDLFIYGRAGKVYPYSTVKSTGFNGAIVDDVSIRSGISFSAHCLRRTFGRELHFTGGVDILLIQFYYNHKTREMTERYIGADEKRKTDGIQKIPF